MILFIGAFLVGDAPGLVDAAGAVQIQLNFPDGVGGLVRGTLHDLSFLHCLSAGWDWIYATKRLTEHISLDLSIIILPYQNLSSTCKY